MPSPCDQSGVEQRRQGEYRRGGVAAGRGDELGADQLRAEELGEAVDEVVEQLRADVVGAVPLGVERRVVEAEVRPEIDDVPDPTRGRRG